MISMRRLPQFLTALAMLCVVTAVPGQISPEDTVKKLLEQVSEEMAEIDRLLLESSRGGEAAERMERNAERMKELVQQSQSSQEKVLRNIDALIEELQKMAQQSSSQSSQSSQDQQQQGGGSPQDRGQPRPGEAPQDQRPGRRDQGQTPEMVDQGQNREGQPNPEGQQRPEGGMQPNDSPQDSNDPGRNAPGSVPQEGATERVLRDGDEATWGELPQYVRFLQRRGGVPEVPAKYRRLHEAWQKRSAKQNR